MRFPLALKIFGLAALLLFLMALVALLSLSRIRQVNNEIANISDYKIPLTNYVNNMVVYALEQEMQLEGIYDTDPQNTSDIQQKIHILEGKRNEFDKAYSAASVLTKKGLGFLKSEEDKLEFTKVDIKLNDIEGKHEVFRDRILETVSLLEKGNKERAYELREIIGNDKREFNTEITKILDDLESFTKRSALEAEQHEQKVLQLNVLMTIGATILGLLFASIITIGLTGPVRQLLAGTKAMEHGNLEVMVRVTSHDEIGMLAQAFNTMARELRVKEHIKARSANISIRALSKICSSSLRRLTWVAKSAT